MERFADGGAIVVLIVLIGIAGLGLLVERLYVVLVKSRTNGRHFIERVIQLVRGGRVDEALSLCAQSSATLPDVGLVILRAGTRDESDLVNVAEAASRSLVPRITQRLSYLPVLANAALLLGILGGLMELRDAFAIGEAAGAEERAAAIFGGVALALDVVVLGFLVALPLWLGHGFLRSQAERLIEEVEEFSTRLINVLIDRPDVRLGHR
jgi:biopolymer transport protein ExbB